MTNDLVGNTKRSRGEVLFTVRIPRERALLSRFDDWHTFLNRSIGVPMLPGETYEEWSPCFDAIRDNWDERELLDRDLPIDQWPPDLRAELEVSRESIFDPTTWGDDSPYLQATVQQLFSEEVVRAVRII